MNNPTLRRTIQQAGHCLVEALAVIERNEDPEAALEDCKQAMEIFRVVVIPALKKKCGLA